MRLLVFLAFTFFACSQDPTPDFYFGADLSYVNELEDCGASYRQNQQKVDPYRFFADQGNNLVRLRLWHSPNWTQYATLTDVCKSIQRAKASHMKVLLDFHYSDNWADPDHQIIPAAWANITDQQVLGDSLYHYTYTTLSYLEAKNLCPDMVQVGNETNSEILMQKPTKENGPTNWPRNAYLLGRGLSAVRDFNKATGKKVETMLHVAQPENAKSWFENAAKEQLTDFDWIGLSYYPNWSTFNLVQLKETISFLKNAYQKEVIIVEAGYPFSMKNFDQASNVLGQKSALQGYVVSPQGQLKFMIDLVQSTKDAGGRGVVYWEPAWVSSSCKTQWGTGSHWENAAFFNPDKDNEALPVFEYYQHQYK